MIEVAHPKRPETDDSSYMAGRSTVRLGSIASGKPIVRFVFFIHESSLFLLIFNLSLCLLNSIPLFYYLI